MASGRVGGTRSKVSGLLGDVVYQVIRNEDGSYTQVVRTKGETTTNYTTPRLQAQRMVMAMVEAMMKELKPVASISMQSAANKSKSLNAFSSFNVQKIARDCVAHWYSGNTFVYPKHSRYDMDVRDLGGLYMISSGTLQYDVFDELLFEPNPRSRFENWPYEDCEFFGVSFNVPNGIQNVGQFLRSHGMSILDMFVFVGFRTWMETPKGKNEAVDYHRHSYIIAQINPEINEDTEWNYETIDNLFVFKADHKPVIVHSQDDTMIAVGFVSELYEKTENYYYWAAFSISSADGKKKISSSSYSIIPPFSDNWLNNSAPANVFGTWMDDPSNNNYPSPFE